jgi:hypothetical protein
LDEALFPSPVHAPYTPFTQNVAVPYDLQAASDQSAFITKAEQRARFDEDMRVISLGEVEVTARRIEKREEPRLQYFLNEMSDVTIQREEIEKFAFSNVNDYLKMVSGVRVSPDGVINIRDARHAEGGLLQALVIIDGMPIGALNELSFTEIESIDVFKGISTTAFGARGAGGVISVTTVRGKLPESLDQNMSNFVPYTPLGYQTPVEFYAPKYETLESRHLTIPDFRTTIFWKPDIVISDNEEETTFEFYTSDFPTTYSVVIEGLTADGRIVRQVEKIQVE